MESACDAAGAPDDIKQTIAGAVMGECAPRDPHGMDKYDRVIASVGIEKAAHRSVTLAARWAFLSLSTMLTNKDGDVDNPEVTSFGRASFTVSGSLSLRSSPSRSIPRSRS